MTRSLRRLRTPMATGLAAALGLAGASRAAVDQAALDAAHALYAQKRFAEAAQAFEHLRGSLDPAQAHLAPSLEFDRGCALLAAQQADAAETAFLAADNDAADPAVRAAARYNLGLIAAGKGDAAAEKDPAGAIEAYRRAERHFRNSLADHAPPPASPQPSADAGPAPSDAARNIEILQRKIAALQKQQEQQKQQQQQQNKDQNKQDQQDKQQQPQNQSGDQQKQDQNKPEQSDQNKQSSDNKTGQDQQQQPQTGQQGKDQQEQAKPEPKDQPDKPDQNQDQQKDARPDAKQQGKAPRPAEPTAQQKREFDRLAAEILDKEKKQRDRLKQYMQMMRARAAPVEKDW